MQSEIVGNLAILIVPKSALNKKRKEKGKNTIHDSCYRLGVWLDPPARLRHRAEIPDL